ncbi:SusD/RagB family nutrient-binding outer membrane lipoprotein [Hymenobacter defluvii]|uniref:SusD/RagB family nutrient-binding outer membrane lipoprotein n=1 Tax=Hymenobacter defluvii TaxID=2054411 RepID=A0ABS3TIR9_9BACT|nr:SusD/RagB family nutrient-binding outer membrane lipoprotein [Hymenobacter defluvii]MBO3273073.1 SusD/RagB family nutrient-binding outer membrane lipoprotein [Hymenobacter defluvii]
MKKQLLLGLGLSMLLATSCVDSLDDYNVDPKSPTTAPGTTFVSNAERNLVRTINSANINANPFRYYVQYWAATDYPQESRYQINTRSINTNYWNPLYRDVLLDLKEAKRNIETDVTISDDVKANQLASAEVLEIFTWATLVETFGNVPYTQALDISNPQPAYDDQKAIYDDLIKRLDAAIAQFKPNATGLGSADLLNNGDTGLWIKFANSLKLRMALTIADVNDAQAKTMAASVSGKVLASNADNVDLAFLSTFPNTNPLFEDLVRSGRNDFVGTSFFINKLKDLQDPRLSQYFNPVIEGGTTYTGGEYGVTNAYTDFSTPGNKLKEPTLPGVVMSYAQVEFMLAEAVARGYSVGGTVEEHYNAAVKASILEWGGTDAAANTYLSQPSVAYATAPGATYKEKIGVQKWIALYNQPTEAYKEWRRLDSPKLTKPSTAVSDIPLRYTYPIAEQSVNGANYSAAAAAIGGDQVTTALFWDKFRQ